MQEFSHVPLEISVEQYVVTGVDKTLDV